MLRLFIAFPLFLMMASLPALGAPSSPSTPPIDLLPLRKALTPLDGSGVLLTHSTIRISGTKQGVSVVLSEDLQITSRRPGSFHAALIQHASAAGPQTKLEVVSNGAAVWTYRPGLRRYSVMTLAAFKKADSDIPTLGLVIGGFDLGDGRPLVEGIHSITATNSADVLAALGSIGVTLSRDTKSFGGQDDYVYSLALTRQKLVYKFYVNSQTGTLARVDLAGTEDGIQVTYREDIQSITLQPPVRPSMFTFAPPFGTVKVADVSINPY